jgi:AcrR family transcriptional regulator
MTDTDARPTEEAVGAEPQPHPWQGLAAEHFRLLRLAPLATDRHTGARPLRFVQLGQAERHSAEQSLLRLTIELPGQRVRSEQNVLEVWADHRTRELRFGPDQGLQLEPTSRGLGRFLVAQGVLWARQHHWSDYRIEGGALAIKDALTDEARQQRDQFLRSQGFDVEYPDALSNKATYGASRVNVLKSDWNHDKVQPIGLLDAAAMLQQADHNLQEQDVKLGKQQQKIDQLKREDSSLRFTIACLVACALFQAGLLIWIATR